MKIVIGIQEKPISFFLKNFGEKNRSINMAASVYTCEARMNWGEKCTGIAYKNGYCIKCLNIPSIQEKLERGCRYFDGFKCCGREIYERGMCDVCFSLQAGFGYWWYFSFPDDVQDNCRGIPDIENDESEPCEEDRDGCDGYLFCDRCRELPYVKHLIDTNLFDSKFYELNGRYFELDGSEGTEPKINDKCNRSILHEFPDKWKKCNGHISGDGGCTSCLSPPNHQEIIEKGCIHLEGGKYCGRKNLGRAFCAQCSSKLTAFSYRKYVEFGGDDKMCRGVKLAGICKGEPCRNIATGDDGYKFCDGCRSKSTIQELFYQDFCRLYPPPGKRWFNLDRTPFGIDDSFIYQSAETEKSIVKPTIKNQLAIENFTTKPTIQVQSVIGNSTVKPTIKSQSVVINPYVYHPLTKQHFILRN